MGIFLITTLLFAGSEGSSVGFQAQLGYEPTLMGKRYFYENPFVLAFPYSAYYFNNRVTGKIGIGLASGWEIRAIGGFARTLIPDGYSPISMGSWYPSYQYTKWRSVEFSAGAEIGRALRFRTGAGDFFLGGEAVWGNYDFDVQFYIYTDTNEMYDTLQASATGFGIQGHVGMNYPIVKFSDNLTLFLTGLVRTGRINLTPEEIPEGAEWGSYHFPEDHGLPRWGVSVGLSGAFDTRTDTDLDGLLDARMNPAPTRSGCLFGMVDKGRSCIGGCCMTGAGSKFGQASTAFLLGPGIGIPLGLFGAMMMFDNDAASEIVPLSLGCYIWSPVGSVLGTMAGGRLFNPGGSWNYTLTGALIGQLANLFIAECYRIAVGANPWRGLGNMSSYYRDEGKGTYVVISAASSLPTIGALIGYNLSLKHAREAEPDQEMGHRPSWSQEVQAILAEEAQSYASPGLSLDLLNLEF